MTNPYLAQAGCQHEEETSLLPDIIFGNEYEYRFFVTDENDEPIDITGWVIDFMVKATYDEADDDSVIRITETVPAGDEAEAGEYVLTIPEADTEVDPGEYKLVVRRSLPTTPRTKTIIRQDIAILADGNAA